MVPGFVIQQVEGLKGVRSGMGKRPFGFTMGLVLLVCWTGAVAGTAAGTPDSIRVLEEVVALQPRNSEAWTRLGLTHLAAGHFERAEGAFKKAIRYGKSAVAYNGLGLVYLNRAGPGQARRALPFFRRALGADSGFFEAQMNIVRAYQKLGDADVQKALERAIQMRPTHAPAYKMLALWYEDFGYEDRQEDLYRQYTELLPDDPDGHYGLARTLIARGEYEAALGVARLAMRDHPEADRFLPLMAQWDLIQGRFEKALAAFQTFLNRLPDAERALYDDLSLVGLPEDLAAYEAAEDKAVFLATFWRKRDWTLTSGGVARRAEHYRRVWYARTYFARKAHPWDRRGEIYIRYGEPDYRSRSDRVNTLPNAAVEAVKDRNALWLQWSQQGMRPFGPLAEDGEKWRDVGSTGWGMDDGPPEGRYHAPTYPVDAHAPWESWVYARLGGGTEFTFTDPLQNGPFGFPTLPSGASSGQAAFELHPATVLQRLAATIPEHYVVPPGVDFLDFYYDLAAFQGTDGNTRIEVYIGVPHIQFAVEKVWEGRKIVAERAVVLDSGAQQVHREERRRVEYGTVLDPEARRGRFAIDAVVFDVPPGPYRLAVQLRDRTSGKWGLYLQELNVPAFSDSLGLSDLELAYTVQEEAHSEKFRKDDVWVIPMPTRQYRRNQSVYVYYEVYHLQRDDFGQTRYRVTYTLRRDVRRGIGTFGALVAGFRKLFAVKRPEVTLSYEGTGTTTWEPIYFELETRKLKPGVNQLEVKVTDLNSGATTLRRTMFQIGKKTTETDAVKRSHRVGF